MSSALIIIAAVTLVALWLGVRARRGHDMNLEQWSVGGRSFGTAFVFLLMAGEIYTTFTFLGASGWAYSRSIRSRTRRSRARSLRCCSAADLLVTRESSHVRASPRLGHHGIGDRPSDDEVLPG